MGSAAWRSFLIRPDRTRHRGKPVPTQQLLKLPFDAANEPRAMKHQRGIKLDKGGPGSDLCVGIRAAGNSAASNDRDPTFGEPVHCRQACDGRREQRLAGQPSGRDAIGARQSRRACDRGIADDEAIDSGRQRHLRDVAHSGFVKIGPNLHQKGWEQTGGVATPELLHVGEQFLDLGAGLQGAQSRCVRRGNVNDQIVRKRPDGLDPSDIVCRTVGGVAILAHVGTDDAGAGAAAREIGDKRSDAAAVEAEAVDHRLVLRQTIEPLARIAGLRPRRYGASLDKSEAERERRVANFRMLVKSGRKSDRVGESQIPDLGGKDRIIAPAPHGAGEAQLERPYADRVGAFRVEEKQRRPRQLEKEIAHYDSSHPGDTICSTAAAIANSRGSAPCSPTSISPTGASPRRWHGTEIAQRSSRLAIPVLRSTSRLTAWNCSSVLSAASGGATTGAVGIMSASYWRETAAMRRIKSARARINSM